MNYTTIEQSKKLLELGLNPESADMHYPMLYNRAIDGGGKNLSDFPSTLKPIGIEDIPCWSLGALLEVMPDSIKNRELLIYKTPYQNTMMWEVGYGYNEINNRISKSLLNSVFNTIVWLLENGYLKKEYHDTGRETAAT